LGFRLSGLLWLFFELYYHISLWQPQRFI
jgi:hypothetical protein